jgi:7,8-didemethyl-8-hydroxy-5-deazariboflavin synthase CofG subunit
VNQKLNLIEKLLPQLEYPLSGIIQKVLEGKQVNQREANLLYEADLKMVPLLMLLANYLREKEYGKIVSFSKNVFIDLTHLCRNSCSYCGFKQEPDTAQFLLLSPEQVLQLAEYGKNSGCHEALLTMGEQPELKYNVYKKSLKDLGNYTTTLEYLRDTCEKIYTNTGLLPHSNPGILNRDELRALKEVNASLGLMLESSSYRLLEKGNPHEFSPGKEPNLRLNTIKFAGELKIPFTTGILVGIGETQQERIDSIFKIKQLHAKYGHIQEIIIQNFLPKPGTPMQDYPPPSLVDMLKITCLTRIVFNGQMNVQVPPNLNSGNLGTYLMAGINDWGGVSPVTIDHVNPENQWPSLQDLANITNNAGLLLRERLPIYPKFMKKDRFISQLLRDQISSLIDEDGYVRTSESNER